MTLPLCRLLGLRRAFFDPLLSRVAWESFRPFFEFLNGLHAEHTLHSGGRDAMAFRDLADALTTLTVLLDRCMVQL